MQTQILSILYRDGSNYKTSLTAKITSGSNCIFTEPLEVGDTFEMEQTGVSIADWFNSILGQPYNPDYDHNILEVVEIINNAENIEVDFEADEMFSYKAADRIDKELFVGNARNKEQSLHEAIADISFLAGENKYYSGNSRADIANFIQWAKEFEEANKDVEWGVTKGKEYIDEITAFADSKMDFTLSFDLRITKAVAMALIRPRTDLSLPPLYEELHIDVMCKEYGQDDDWVGLQSDDWENVKDDDEYKTFEVYFDSILSESDKQDIIDKLDITASEVN